MAYDGPDASKPTVTTFADLDGDGRPEILVDYPTSATSSGVTLLQRIDHASCFAVLYSGSGGGLVPRKSRTSGRLDLELGLRILTDSGWGGARVLLTFDGTKYRWKEVLNCSSMAEPNVSLGGCAELAAEYDPDRPSPGSR